MCPQKIRLAKSTRFVWLNVFIWRFVNKHTNRQTTGCTLIALLPSTQKQTISAAESYWQTLKHQRNSLKMQNWVFVLLMVNKLYKRFARLCMWLLSPTSDQCQSSQMSESILPENVNICWVFPVFVMTSTEPGTYIYMLPSAHCMHISQLCCVWSIRESVWCSGESDRRQVMFVLEVTMNSGCIFLLLPTFSKLHSEC